MQRNFPCSSFGIIMMNRKQNKNRKNNPISLESGRIAGERLGLASFPANTNDVSARDTRTWRQALCSKVVRKDRLLLLKDQTIFIFFSRLSCLLISIFFLATWRRENFMFTKFFFLSLFLYMIFRVKVFKLILKPEVWQECIF